MKDLFFAWTFASLVSSKRERFFFALCAIASSSVRKIFMEAYLAARFVRVRR